MKQVKFILPLLLMVACIGNVWGATTAKVNDVLWQEQFTGTTTSTSTSFSATNATNIAAVANSAKGTSMLVSTDIAKIAYTASNVMLTASTGANCSGAHIWINKSTTGYFQVTNIPLYGATKVKVSWAQGGATAASVQYAFDGGSSYTALSSNAKAAAEFVSSELNTNGHTSISLKFVRTSTTTNLRMDNLKLFVTEVATPSTYTLHFDVQGHGTAPTDQTNISAGGKGTEPTAPTCTGYTFGGWYENSECSGSQWNFSTGTISANKTLYAKWTAKTYTITLDENGHGAADGSATATYDATTLSSVSGVTANTGYVLNGYFTATSGGTKVINVDGTLVSNVSGYTDATGKWNKDAACTLYAQYTQQFTITFIDKLQNTTGYTGPTGHTLQVADGATFTFPDALSDGTPTAEQKASGTCEQQHYHFVGWILSTEESTANNTGHANVKAAGSTSGTVSAAATYYAVWAKEE